VSLYHLSSGEIFRGLDPESTAGKIFAKHANSGNLLPDDVTIQLWLRYVRGLVATNSYLPNKQLLLLDGLPRTENQAHLLKPYIQVVAIIALEVLPEQEDILIHRVQKRALLEKRADDSNVEVFRRRLHLFNTETERVLAFYPQDKILRINAVQHPVHVLRDTLNVLGDALVHHTGGVLL
jgi:adenylate kinase